MVVHFISILYAGFMIYTAAPGSSLFSWHPTLMVFGFAFFMLQGILVFSPHSSFLAKASRQTKVRAHWVCMCMAVIYLIGGMLAILINKERNNAEHLTTVHGKIGALTSLYTILQCLAGVFLLYPAYAPNGITLKQMKAWHATSGLALFALVCVSLFMGMNSTWFTNNVTGTSWYACVACPMIFALAVMNQVAGRYMPKMVVQ